MAIIRDPAARVASLLSQSERRLTREFVLAIARIRDSLSLTVLASLLEQGRINEALAFAEALAARLSALSRLEFVNSGTSTAQHIASALPLGVVFDFDQVNRRAVDRIRRHGAALLREARQSQIDAARDALTDGVTRGLNPRQTARAVRETVGLTARQVRAVRNYRALLQTDPAEALSRELRDRRFDRTVRRSALDRRPLTTDQVDRMVNRYRQNYVRYRAETIARTESLRAVNGGHDEAYLQAEEAGVIRRDSTVRVWTPASDARVRDSHSAMRGQARGIREPFVSGAGNILQYPGDPDAPPADTIQCRCTLAVRTEI